MRWFVLLVLLLLAPHAANAGSTPDLAGIAYEQRNGVALPLRTALRDDDGKIVRLGAIVDGRPLVLTLGYFHCASLCDVVRTNLLAALDQTLLVAGRDYSFAAVSVDPSETAQEAAAVKAKDLEAHPAFPPEHFHFLTGQPDTVASLAEAVGFKSRSPRESRFVHPLGVVLIAPSGVVSGYLLGIGYPPDELRAALRGAGAGVIGPTASPFLLLCYDFDAATGRYTFAIMKILRLVSAATAAIALAALARVTFGGRLRQ